MREDILFRCCWAGSRISVNIQLLSCSFLALSCLFIIFVLCLLFIACWVALATVLSIAILSFTDLTVLEPAFSRKNFNPL